MAMFPKIQSPCPYQGNLSAVMDGDFCRMCKRNVVDLTAWSDEQRVSFLASCETEVCVSYRLPLRPALAAAAMVAAMAALPAAAQDAPVAAVAPADAAAPNPVVDAVDTYEPDIVVGGITDPKHAEFVEDAGDAAMPTLPVVYEDAKPVTAPKTRKPAAP